MELNFVSLDTWTLIFTWLNLLILFLIVKKLFFKPMQKMLSEREKEISSSYERADAREKEAEDLKASYEEKISHAEGEAEKIVSNAVAGAEARSGAIVKEAEEKASAMIERAQKSIEAQRETAFSELKEDVSSMAVEIAKKIIERDIDEKDHERLINEALEGLGGKK